MNQTQPPPRVFARDSLLHCAAVLAAICLWGNFKVCAQSASVILGGPQSQNVLPGANVTLSVAVAGMTTQVASGTNQLWLRADAGVITNAGGQLSEWMDQSGHNNNAYQSSSIAQPVLEYPAALGGLPAIRFNGNQTPNQGTFLQGTNSVGIPDAYTSFLVYEMDSGAPTEQIPSLVGVPGYPGSSRSYYIPDGDMAFATWSDDYNSYYSIPQDTYRIWTVRYSTSLGTLELFDDTPSSSTSFDFSTSGQSPPAPGYYVGGLNIAVANVGTSRIFGGDIAELIYYQGELTDDDRASVVSYLEQKYFQVAPPDSFQWFFNQTVISDATNSTLTLSDVASTASGDYSVIVSNAAGFVQSTNATLFVGVPPGILSQPQSQAVLPGANETFSVTATGTSLAYQWFMNGAALSGETNASLSLTNVTTNNAGLYVVTLSNPYAALSSQPAALGIVTLPVIETQPQSQAAVVGSNINFTVAVAGGGVSGALPAITSGTLELWLRADYGVLTNGAGAVSEWLDLSGNGNNAVQSNPSLQPILAYAPAIGNLPVVRFNGVQNTSAGDYLEGTNKVAISNAMTAFLFYELNYDPNAEEIGFFIGVPGSYGAGRGDDIKGGAMDFVTWNYDYTTPFVIPTNTYRIWTDRFNTNLSNAQVFDDSEFTSTNFSFATSGESAPAAGYYVGGLNPAVQGTGAPRIFGGDIGELIIYQGMLSESDRLAVVNYLKQKYYQINGADLSFQWLFDGTNIAGATNASLSLSDVQTTNAGAYAVVVTNAAGSVTSSNAILTIDVPPAITVQPQSQSAGLCGSVTFSAVAGGGAPLSYQWLFDSAKISHATNSSLALTGIQGTNGGTYALVVTNLYGSITSSNAVLTVLTSAVQIVSIAANGSTTAFVPVQLLSAGNENTIDFSVNYSNSVLTYTGAALGSNAAGAFLVANTSQTNSGRLGVELELPGGAAFPFGTQQVAVISFAVAQLSNGVVTPVTFGSQPTPEEVFNAQFTSLPAFYSNGLISLAATGLAGDVSPRTNGDGVVLLNDWFQEGRFVAGLDTISNASEFQRADCAPRATSGDGLISVADWVQVGRYAAGFDPPTFVTARTGSTGTFSNAPSASRILSLAAAAQGGLTNTVNLQLAAQGNENALSCSIAFNAASLGFSGATLGPGAAGAMLNVNTNQLAVGNLGLAVALLPGSAISPGTQPIVQLSFTSISYSNTLQLSFGDFPVGRQIADTNADVLPVSFQNGSLTVAGSSWPLLSVSRNGANVSLSWPSSAGGFVVQSTSSLSQNWTNVAGSFSTNSGVISTTLPITAIPAFYRLQHP